ncbi:serine/threonine-protein kinase [Demequina pelophila]|uniref:serine/threonine-protein kinase n=1 Tax=Demequina pelophila TaxID=1638984 RepID=UPI0007805B63|nr:serine/threonine-protein kinase [Demequina pelophila]
MAAGQREVGEIVGGYRVLARLGTGGSGSVYRVVDEAGVESALKLVDTEDEVARARLEREVKALQALRHPAVPHILDAELDDDETFVVFEFVPGQTLWDHVQAHGPLEGEALADFADRTASALEAVHAAGVIHRDVTPSNVMMSPEGPVLIDFGLAHRTDDARLTREGLVSGTPGYVAPEVIDGAEPGTAADRWSWAATVAYAMAAQAPFGSGTGAISRTLEARPSLPPVPGADALVAALGRDEHARPGMRDVVAALRGARPEAIGPGDAWAAVPGVGAAAPTAPHTIPGPVRDWDDAAHPALGGGGGAGAGATAVMPGAQPGVAPAAAWPGPDPTAVMPASDPTAVMPTSDSTAVMPTSDPARVPGVRGGEFGGHGDHWGDESGDWLGGPGEAGEFGPPEGYGAPGEFPEPAPAPPRPVKRRGLLALAGAAIVVAAPLAPVAAYLTLVALAVLARGVRRRRLAIEAAEARRGVRRTSDAVVQTLGLPWHTVRGAFETVPAALTALAAGAGVGAGAWWLVSSGTVAGPSETAQYLGHAAAVALGALAAVIVMGWGPFMRDTRAGAHRVAAALSPTRGLVIAWGVVAVAAMLVVAIAVYLRVDVWWWPLPDLA